MDKPSREWRVAPTAAESLGARPLESLAVHSHLQRIVIQQVEEAQLQRAVPNATQPTLFLARFSPKFRPFYAILRHFSPVLSVLAPGSRRLQKNGKKTAQNVRKVAEKIGGQVALAIRPRW